MPAKCVSSVSPRFHYRRIAFCFLPLAAILEFSNDFSLCTFFLNIFLALAEFTEADEAMAELAVADNVFLFLTESVVVSESFYQEEFYIRRTHNLITDFLALMPMKVSVMM
jgi:hypothetical protein